MNKKYKINLQGYEVEIEQLSNGKFKKPDFIKKQHGFKSSICPLKETHETLLVFRKPFKYSICTDIILKEIKGDTEISGCGINIGGNRVGIDNLENEKGYRPNAHNHKHIGNKFEGIYSPIKEHTKQDLGYYNSNGRYPSNLYLIDGFNYTPEQIKEILVNKQLHIFENIGIDIEPLEYMTEDKQIEYICNYLDKFEVSKVLDEQSGNLKSGDDCIRTKVSDSYHGNFGKSGDIQTTYGDEGGCSRILHKSLYELEEFNIFNYCTKVNSHERESMISGSIKEKSFGQSNQAKAEILRGNDSFKGNQNGMNNVKRIKNTHPTLKNMNLQHKIMNLFLCPKEDIKDFKILIPFCGVQSEYMSAMALGIPEENITGIEISKEYCEIGEARKSYWTKHNFYFKETKKEANELKEEAIKKDKQVTGKKLF